MDAFFAQYYARHPVTATFTGIHDHDARLPDWSAAGRATELAEMRAMHEQLRAASPLPASGVASLRDNPVALDAELARANLDVRIAETESGHFVTRNPSLWTGEAIFGVVSLMIRDFAPAAERYRSLIARLAAVPPFLGDMQHEIVKPVPALWRARAVKECAAAQQLLGDGLAAWCKASQTEACTTEDTGVTEAARRAFAEASRWLEGLDDDGDGLVACGESLITVLLRRGHFCDEAPRALLARAEEEIAREASELQRMVDAQFGGQWSNAQAAMAADRAAVGTYYETFARRWHEVRAAAQAHDVVTWPEWPIRYVPIPVWAREAQPALYWLFYRSPAPFDRYTTYEYVVAPIDESMPPAMQQQRLAGWNHSTITLNHVVHHGGLGHHVQNWHATHRSTSRVGKVAAVDAANRIGMFLGGSMAEGWACYATQLAEELGVLTPLEVVSEQHTRVRLLARAVADLRLHLGDWSFAQCVQFYQSRVGMSVDVATAEATKNSMFPATAVMYWLGTQAILNARAQQRAKHGAAFSLKGFHDALLSRGAIPALLAARLLPDSLEPIGHT